MLGAGSLSVAAIVVLTVVGIVAHGTEGAAAGTSAKTYDPAESGRLLFDELGCRTCHIIHGEGKDYGPDLSRAGMRLKSEYMRQWITAPQSFKPDTEMPAAKATRHQIDELVSYLQTLKDEVRP